MSALKLTEKDRACLTMAANFGDGGGCEESTALLSAGLLKRVRLTDGTLVYAITDAGRAALKDGAK